MHRKLDENTAYDLLHGDASAEGRADVLVTNAQVSRPGRCASTCATILIRAQCRAAIRIVVRECAREQVRFHECPLVTQRSGTGSQVTGVAHVARVKKRSANSQRLMERNKVGLFGITTTWQIIRRQ